MQSGSYLLTIGTGGNSDSAFFYQDASIAANNSLFSQQKQSQLQTLAFDEKLRQLEIVAAELKDKKREPIIFNMLAWHWG